jgi:hypothetical protein
MTGTCCEPITSDEELDVNDGTGHDVACCGPVGTPCQSLTQVTTNLTAANANFAVVVATHDASGPTWASVETLPIQLNHGVTLKAPGVYFTGTSATPANPYFAIQRTNTLSDSYTVELEGSSSKPVYVGLAPSTSGGLSNAGTNLPINVTGMTLQLSDAVLSTNVKATSSEIVVLNGGNLVVGPGPVVLGGDLTAGTRGYDGIYCQGQPGNPSSITDVDGGVFSAPVLTVSNMLSQDLVGQDYCNITLTNGLQLGSFGASVGANPPTDFLCNTDVDGGKIDGNGISLYGKASATIANANIACFVADAVGVYLANPDGGLPTLDLEDSNVGRAGCSGLNVAIGSAAVSDVTFTNSYDGVTQIGDGGTDLSGASALHNHGGSTLVCNGAAEPGACQGAHADVGFNVLNNGVKPLNASGCTWDFNPPSTFSCTDPQATQCTPTIMNRGDAVVAPDPTAMLSSTIDVSRATGLSNLVCPH